MLQLLTEDGGELLFGSTVDSMTPWILQHGFETVKVQAEASSSSFTLQNKKTVAWSLVRPVGWIF